MEYLGHQGALGAGGGFVSGEIVDEGVPFDPTAAPDPDVEADIDERSIGGLGVHLVKAMVETFQYQRIGERNVVRFTLRIPGDE